MKWLIALPLLLSAASAWACDSAICRVDPDSLNLPQIITFDGTQSGYGPGHLVNGLLPLPGAVFGEHFAGQTVLARGTHDQISGPAFGPLTVQAGAAGQNLSVVSHYGNAFLNGYGTAGFPRRDAQGEGAIAVMFDNDQAALAFDLRGGESGAAKVQFLARDGRVIDEIAIVPTGEFAVGFIRATGHADIAGLVITNTDPQGMAIDTIRFGKPPDLS